MTPLALTLLVAAAAPTPPFVWSADRASVAGSLEAYDGKDTIHLVHHAGRTELRLERAGKLLYRFVGGPHTVCRVSEGRLYYAEYSPIASGCAVVAVDLEKGRLLWRTRLRGLGPVGHSQYLNRVVLDVAPAPHLTSDRPPVVVTVYARESNGDYAEFLDLDTGKTVFHHVYPPAP